MHAMQAYGTGEVKLHSITLDTTLSHGRLNPCARAPVPSEYEPECVQSQLDALEKGKISYLPQESNHGSSVAQPLA